MSDRKWLLDEFKEVAAEERKRPDWDRVPLLEEQPSSRRERDPSSEQRDSTEPVQS